MSEAEKEYQEELEKIAAEYAAALAAYEEEYQSKLRMIQSEYIADIAAIEAEYNKKKGFKSRWMRVIGRE